MKKVFKGLQAIVLIFALMLSNFMMPAKVKAAGIPETYDLRNVDGKCYVTPLRGQVVDGNNENQNFAWACAACAAMESNALIQGIAENDIDFSEMQLGYVATHYAENLEEGKFEPSLEGEGVKYIDDHISWYAIRTLSLYEEQILLESVASAGMKGFAPKLEDSKYTTTYNYSNEFNNSPYRLKAYHKFDLTLGRDKIKKMIMQYGALAVPIQVKNRDTDSYYNVVSNASYVPSSNFAMGTMTAVIIGWDDNYSSGYFLTDPGSDGAWIVRYHNGSESGEMYVSYKDYSFTHSNYVYAFEVESNLDENNEPLYLYQYDGGDIPMEVANDTYEVAIAFKATDYHDLTGIKLCVKQVWGDTPATVTISKKAASGDEIIDTLPITIPDSRDHSNMLMDYQDLVFPRAVRVNKDDEIRVTVQFSYPVNVLRTTSTNFVYGHLESKDNVATGQTYNGNLDFGTVDATVCIKVCAKKYPAPQTDPDPDPDPDPIPIPDPIPPMPDPIVNEEMSFYMTNNEEGCISLSWKKQDGAEGYRVYRKAEGGEYVLIAELDNNTFTYKDDSLRIGSKYTYKVVAFVGNDESKSPEKTLMATIKASWIRKLDNNIAGQVKVNASNVNGATRYGLYRQEGSTFKWIAGSKVPTLIDRRVKKGVTYYYKTRAYRENLMSALSLAKSIKVTK